jgi:hypothetical protein
MRTLFLSVLVALSLSACTPRPWETAPVAKYTGPTVVAPVDYGQGVLYFPAVGTNYAKSLSAYLARHPDVVYVDSVADDSEGPGRTCGYVVKIRPKTETCPRSAPQPPSPQPL